MAGKNLKEAYEKVFDAQGNVRACGRKACVELIEECEREQPYTYFGDTKTGRMNIEAIKEVINSK